MKSFFLFAPGAGAPSTHPWMQRWRKRLGEIGEVETFDYDYMREGRKRPDRLPQLLATHRAAFAKVRAKTSGSIILIGKSMGGRIGCHVALGEKVNGVVCLSYPLCGGGDRSKLRDQVLRDLRTPILFVQGTRDPFGSIEEMETALKLIPAKAELLPVEGAGHDLGFKGKAKREDLPAAISAAFQNFFG